MRLFYIIYAVVFAVVWAFLENHTASAVYIAAVLVMSYIDYRDEVEK